MLFHLMSRLVPGRMDNCLHTHSEHHGVQTLCTDHCIDISHSNMGPSLLRGGNASVIQRFFSMLDALQIRLDI